MGAANVIPGVSGGTIAFITGVYERLIAAIRAFDLVALRLLTKLQVRAFLKHIDFGFLAALGLGAVASVLSLAKLLEFLFARHEVAVWAFFFGLILASIPFVARAVRKWGAGPVVAALVGIALAAGLAFVPRAGANDGAAYVFVCGIVAISSMIIPGLSGSFVLLLMGNYFVVLGAISGLDLAILIPFGVGCVVGLAALSRLLTWIFAHHHDVAVALITGFVAGSLLLIWPWKETVYERDEAGNYLVKTADRELVERGDDLAQALASVADGEELVVVGYADWHLPDFASRATWVQLLILLLGAALVWGIERAGSAGSRKADVGTHGAS